MFYIPLQKSFFGTVQGVKIFFFFLCLKSLHWEANTGIEIIFKVIAQPQSQVL